jgi:hypothetical protein
MAVYTWDAPIREVCGDDQTINIAGTPTNYQAVRPGFREVKLVCDTAWRFGLSPKLLHCLYYTVAGGYTDYVKTVTDTTAVHMHINSMLNTSYIYLCTSDPVLGFYFDVTDANAEAADLDWEYCSTAQTLTAAPVFTDVAGDSDQTKTAQTLDKDGEYVFTYVDVVRTKLGTGNDPVYSRGYWYRFKPTITLTNPTSIANIIPIYKSATDLGYMSAAVEYNIGIDTPNVGGWYAQCSAEKHLYICWIR